MAFGLTYIEQSNAEQLEHGGVIYRDQVNNRYVYTFDDVVPIEGREFKTVHIKCNWSRLVVAGIHTHHSVLVTILFFCTVIVNASTKTFVDVGITVFKIMWNDYEFKPNMPVVTFDGKSYIPIREFANEAGFIVDWNGENKSVMIKKSEFFCTQEGGLDNDSKYTEVKYTFFGKDKYNLSLDKVFEHRAFSPITWSKYNGFGKIPKTPKEAALSVVSSSFSNKEPWPDVIWSVDVFLDYKTDCWVIEIKHETIPLSITEETIDGTPTIIMKGSAVIIEGDIVCIINRNDGTFAAYSTFAEGEIIKPQLTTSYNTTKSVIEAEITEFEIMWDGEEFKPEAPILLIDGRTYVPLCEFANKAGLTIHWNTEEALI